MNKSNSSNGVICSDVSQTIKREPASCKISSQSTVCDVARPSASEPTRDAIVGVSNYQASRSGNSSGNHTYHHVGDKCIQTATTNMDSSFSQQASVDSRTMTVNSSYHGNNITGNGRPVTSTMESTYQHSTNNAGRSGTVAATSNSAYHHSVSSNTITNTTYQHNTAAGSSGEAEGGGGGTEGSNNTSGTNIPSTYQEGVGNCSISSGYHLHHGSGMVPGNGGTMGQVNAPPGYYYSPILNSQQTLLRPIMAAQPPLYSPLLTPQQHSYPPMPHASPSAGSSYFATLESMRGTLTDMLPGTSENGYKETNQSGRQGSTGTAASVTTKSCEAPDPRNYAMEMCQRRLQQEGGYNSSSYPSCSEVSRTTHEQRGFDEYARMSTYGEDGSVRNWDSMGACAAGSSTGRSAAAHNHMAHPYTYSYADCRLDVAWNKCVAGMSVGTMGGTSSVSGENFHTQEPQLDVSQAKSGTRGTSSHALAVNMNMGVPAAGDSSVSRSHYDYGAQIPPFLPYLPPLNYQQVPDNRMESRSEQRLNSSRSDTQVCDSQVAQTSNRQLEHAHASSGVKLPNINEPAPAEASTSSYAHTTTQHNTVSASPSSVSLNHQECLRQQKNLPSHHVQHCGHGNYKKESTDKDTSIKSQPCEMCPITENQQTEIASAAAPIAAAVPCPINTVEPSKPGTSSLKKELEEESSGVTSSNRMLCLVCDTTVNSTNDGQQESRSNQETNLAASHSMDTLTTVMSKISVGEKLGAVLGVMLPRDLLHSTTICTKCFHLVNELDVMEHRLAHYRKYIITKLETTSEKYGIRLGIYRRLQQQQQQQQQQHQFHQQQQHLQQHQQQHQQQQQQHQQHQQNQMMIQYQSLQTHQHVQHPPVQQEHHSQQQAVHQLQNAQHQQLASLHHQQQQHQQLQQHGSQHTLNQMQSHQIYVAHQHHDQQPQQQQHHLTFQHHHPKTQALQEVVSQNITQQEVVTHNITQQEVVTQSIPQQQEIVSQEVTQQQEVVTHLEQPPTQPPASKSASDDANNVIFVDCDIDIEDCERNLIGDSQVTSTIDPIGKEEVQNSESYEKVETEVQVSSTSCIRGNSEYIDIHSVTSEPQQTESVEKSGQSCSQVLVEDANPGCSNENEVTDHGLTIDEEQKEVISSQDSPDVSIPQPKDDLRNIEDATEYHKPTLLTKNIKAKKHAKLQICRQCDQVFSSRQALVRHIERRHKAYAFHFSCDTCHKKFSSEKALTRHVHLHKTYPCKLCDNIFLRKAKLKKHLQNHTEESLTCENCSKECATLQALIAHMKSHQKKVSKCDVCAKTFARNRNLRMHMRVHTGEKPHSCDNCRRQFNQLCNMQAHRDVCTGQFRHKCQTCGKGFAYESVYQRHLAEHEGQFAYCCSVCGRGFSKASGLKEHLTIHSNQRQIYNCQVPGCGKTLSSISGYNSHVASHKCDGGYVCPVCGKTVKRQSDLKDHLHRHAGTKSHTCPVCDATFYFRTNLSHHVRTTHGHLRPYACKYCDKSFSSTYNYKAHIRTHTGEKPHQCKSCGKTFGNKGNYNRHLKCHVTQAMTPLSAEGE